MHRLYIALVLAMVAAIASFGLVLAQETVTVTLNAQNNSGQDGTATLTARGNQTEVVINVQPGATGVAQPAHVHTGMCPDVGPVKYPLTSVTDGKSTTMVNAPIGDLLAGNLAINVHKSGQEASVYVSCGNIPLAAAPTALPQAGDESWPVVAGVVMLSLALLGIGFALRRQTA